MLTIVAKNEGGTEVLELNEVPTPQPDKNEVLIKVYSASINPVDYKIRESGMNRKFPIVLGNDVSGIITAIGENVTKFKVGDEVFAALDFTKMGGYGEFVLSDESLLTIKPKSITHNEAAAAPLAALTAWQALFDHGKLQAGQKVLIHAAAGGVGHFAVQFAKWKGAYVYGTASSSNKTFLESIGVNKIIDYHNEDFTKIATDIDLVFDAAGTEISANGSLVSLKSGGRFITIVRMPESDLIKEKSIFVHGFLYTPNGKQLSEIAELMQKGIVKSEIAKVFHWTKVGEAHNLLEEGHTRGKLVLEVL